MGLLSASSGENITLITTGLSFLWMWLLVPLILFAVDRGLRSVFRLLLQHFSPFV